MLDAVIGLVGFRVDGTVGHVCCFLASVCLRQRICGGPVTGEVDRGVFVELGKPVVGLDHPDRAGLRPHDDRLGGAAAAVVVDALQQVTVGDPGGAEEDVLPGHQVLGGEHLVQVVAGVDAPSGVRRRRSAPAWPGWRRPCSGWPPRR